MTTLRAIKPAMGGIDEPNHGAYPLVITHARAKGASVEEVPRQVLPKAILLSLRRGSNLVLYSVTDFE